MMSTEEFKTNLCETDNTLSLTLPRHGDLITRLVLYSKSEKISIYVDSVTINILQYRMTHTIYEREEPFNKFVNILHVGPSPLPEYFYNIAIEPIPTVCLVDAEIECIIKLKAPIHDAVLFCTYGLYKQDLRKTVATTEYCVPIEQHQNFSFLNVREKSFSITELNKPKEIVIRSTQVLTDLKISLGNTSEALSPEYYRVCTPYEQNYHISVENEIYCIPISFNVNIMDADLYLKTETESDIYITSIRDNAVVYRNGTAFLKYTA